MGTTEWPDHGEDGFWPRTDRHTRSHDRRSEDPAWRFRDDLVGLDPDDPDARAFAEHLDRMERTRPGFTIEGSLGGVQDFADSANRIGGHRRMTAGFLVILIVFGVLVAVWDTITLVLSTFFG